MGQDDGTTARDGRSGRLSPWADPVTGALGWQAATPSRRLAALIAETVPAGEIPARGKGEWKVRIPQPVLMVTVMSTDAAALECGVCINPNPGIFTLKFTPWSTATVLQFPVTALPAPGMLSVREVRMTTRMGRIVRYLIPEFIPP